MTEQSKKEDHRQTLIWIVEEDLSNGHVLSDSGVSAIAHHQYKPGQYTFFDNYLNSFWQKLTDGLPSGLAPNTVTSIGGSCCLLSYLLTAHYNFDPAISSSQNEAAFAPAWLLTFNGLCLFVYYTFDCMDGKQARRTKSSTPLGQLFDHGVDCVCNLSHVSLMQLILRLNGVSLLWLQTTLQLGFFQAQWEEYYTGSLPHAAGNIGTTEVMYGVALWGIGTGLGLLDQSIYSQPIPAYLNDLLWSKLPTVRLIIANDRDEAENTLYYRDLFILIWVYGYGVLAILSFLRVVSKVPSSPKMLFSALTKLISPVSLCIAAIYVGLELEDTDGNDAAAVDVSKYGGVRFPSLCIGLVFCTITIKLIVYGMAHMSYASLQLDVFPIWLIVGFYQLLGSFPNKVAILQQVFVLASVAYLVRLIWWTRTAIDQICQRLNIEAFAVVGEKHKTH
eukprot:scaffold5966_cov118-Cylindrotheca_fusiformis.AAC.7